MMRRSLPLAVLALAGCATAAGFDARMQTLLGLPVSELVQRIGVPDGDFTAPDGRRFLQYERLGTSAPTPAPSMGFGMGRYGWGGGGWAGVGHGRHHLPAAAACRVTFEIQRDRVASFSRSGGAAWHRAGRLKSGRRAGGEAGGVPRVMVHGLWLGDWRGVAPRSRQWRRPGRARPLAPGCPAPHPLGSQPAPGHIDRVMVPFRKMHGLGNDFVVLDARARALPVTPTRAPPSRTVISASARPVHPAGAPPAGADVFMRILNPDGSEAGPAQCQRCIASLVAEERGADRVVVRTIAGELPVERLPGGLWRADMGPARLGWRDIPLAREMDTLHLPLAAGPVADPAACSMGNPHATFFVDELDAVPIGAIGPGLERDPIFPDRANIGFRPGLAPTACASSSGTRRRAHPRLRVRRLPAIVNAVRRG